MTSRPWLDLVQNAAGGSNRGILLEPSLLLLAVGLIFVWWLQRYRNVQDQTLFDRRRGSSTVRRPGPVAGAHEGP